MKHYFKFILFVSVFLVAQSIFSQQKEPTHKSMVTGYGFTRLEKEGDQPSKLEIGFNPIFLWSINNNVFFEGELEFELGGDEAEIALEYAQIMYVVNKYITFGAGKFLSPNNIFAERFHPAWINKLPTMPLGLSGHGSVPLLPTTQFGFQFRGAIPLGSMKLTYTGYVSNGPALNVDEENPLPPSISSGPANIKNEVHAGGPSSGTLNFENLSDNNGAKAYGGRISFLPVPELELGYGFETARVGADDTEYSNVNAFTNVFDLSFVKDLESLQGRLDIKSQFVLLNVDNPKIGELDYENNSNAWYGQIAFQPYYLNNFLKDVEFVLRYDKIDLPEFAEANTDQNRIAVGLNYWLNHSTVLKVTYESLSSQLENETETEAGYFFQVAMGF